MSCRIRRTQLMAQASLPEKPQNQAAQAELNNKLAQLQAERNRQDTFYFGGQTTNKCETTCEIVNNDNRHSSIVYTAKALEVLKR